MSKLSFLYTYTYCYYKILLLLLKVTEPTWGWDELDELDELDEWDGVKTICGFPDGGVTIEIL